MNRNKEDVTDKSKHLLPIYMNNYHMFSTGVLSLGELRSNLQTDIIIWILLMYIYKPIILQNLQNEEHCS